MERGDIIQRYRKHNHRSADFYVVLGEKKSSSKGWVSVLGFYIDGTVTSMFSVWHKDLEERYRVVGHSDFIFDITKQIELITVDKKDNK